MFILQKLRLQLDGRAVHCLWSSRWYDTLQFWDLDWVQVSVPPVTLEYPWVAVCSCESSCVTCSVAYQKSEVRFSVALLVSQRWSSKQALSQQCLSGRRWDLVSHCSICFGSYCLQCHSFMQLVQNHWPAPNDWTYSILYWSYIDKTVLEQWYHPFCCPAIN